MKENRNSQGMQQEKDQQVEEPQVYAVHEDLAGRKLSRRELLAAAGAAAAVATAAAVGGGDRSAEVSAEEASGDSTVLALTVLRPNEPGTIVWQFRNDSEIAWGEGTKLHFVDGDQMQAPASVAVPRTAPGETAAIEVDMVAPTEPGIYQGSWRLEVTDDVTHTVYLPLVLLNQCIVASFHPYENDLSETWWVVNPDSGAHATRVHFSRVDVQSGSDYIILMDSTGQEYQHITGTYPKGLWSNPVPGGVVQVRLVTDSTVTGWGFCLDQVETTSLFPTSTSTPSATSTHTPIPTSTPTRRPTHTPSRTITPIPTATRTPTRTPRPTRTRRPTSTPIQTHYWYPN